MTAEKIVTKQVICASDDFSIKLPTIKRRRRRPGDFMSG